MGLLVVQQATSMAVRTPTLGTAEGPFLISSHCGLDALPCFTALSTLSGDPGGFCWGLLGFALTGEICLILHSPSFGASGLLYQGWYLTKALGMSLQVAG